MENTVKQKIEQSISNSNEVLNPAIKKYVEAVESSLSHVTLLVAHKTCSEANANVEIENTDLFKNATDIKLNFDITLKSEMNDEEDKISSVLIELDQISLTVIQQCDKIWNVFRSLQKNLSFEELTHGTCESLPISSKLEAFDLFKRKFYDGHYARKYSFAFYKSGGSVNELLQFWSISDLKKAYNDLQCAIMD